MAVKTVEPPMADKVKSVSVKLHEDVVESARIIAAYRNEAMTDMLSGLLRPLLSDLEQREITRRMSAQQSSPSKPKKTEPPKR